MPITTILQHQRDREKLNQPDLGTRIAEDDHNIRNKDTIKEVRLSWALAIERYVGVSLLTKEEKAVAVAGQWVTPDPTCQSKILNNPKSGCSEVATSSTKKNSSRSRKTKQTNSSHPITSGKTTAQPRAMPFDRHSPREVPTVNCDPGRASCTMQQNTQPSRTSKEPQQSAPSEHHGGPPSPTDSVYEVARRAVDFLDIHKTQDTAPGINGPQLVAATTHLGELGARERCNIMRTPPASHTSAQTSPSAPSGEKAPPIRWSTIQTYPSCRDAIVFSDKTRERGMASGQQRTSTQRRRQSSQPFNGPRPKSKSAAARRRAMLKHSVTYTLPAANPRTPVALGERAVYHPTTTSNQVHPPQLVAVSQSTNTLRQATPVHSVMTLRPGPPSYPRSMPRSSTSMSNTQPPARWQPIYPKPTHPQSTLQPPVISQQATTVVETNRERGHRLRREAQLRKEASLRCRDGPPLHGPEEPAIVGFVPSVKNRVVEHLIKHNPEAVVASKLSHTIPKETAVHYNSVLTWQAENAQATGDPPPHGHPTHINEVESRRAPSDGVPGSQEAQSLAPIVVPIRSMPVSQQLVSTENHPHGRSDTLAPQCGVPSHPYSRVSSGEAENAPNEYGIYSSVSTQQSMYEHTERRVMDDCDNDVQEISRQDWQAANEDSPRYRAGQRTQSVVASAPYERTVAYSASASSVYPQSIPEPFFDEDESMMLPLSPELPIHQTPVSISAQAQAQTVKRPSSQANPKYGGIHKRKSSRAGRTSPPQTRVSQMAMSRLVHSPAELPNSGVPQTAVRRIAVSQLVLPSTVPRIAISQLVHSSTVPRIAISQLVHSSAEVPKTVVPRVAISQLVHSSAEVPKTVVPRVAISQLVHSSPAMPQTAMPRTSPRTPLPSARPNKQRRVRLSRGGMWLSQDDLDRWQEERRNPYRLPSFNDSFSDATMIDYHNSHEQQTFPEPAGGVFGLDAYRINPVTSCARNWLGMVHN
ncbi:hypothetical protein V8C34DRAFT_239871 [Trichoderma compactum]